MKPRGRDAGALGVPWCAAPDGEAGSWPGPPERPMFNGSGRLMP